MGASTGSNGNIAVEIRVLMERNNLNFCLECGKCSPICPMVNLYGEYVRNRCTRNIVERLSFDPGGFTDEALWYCWACKECTFFCPSGVNFQDFMTDFRKLMVSHNQKENAHLCSTCGSYLMPKRQLEVLLKQNLHEATELLYECQNCKKERCAAVLHKMSAKGKPFPAMK